MLNSLNKAPLGSTLEISAEHLPDIILKCREIFLSEDMLLRVKAPLRICGDTHGQFYDLLKIFNIGGHPPKSRYLFLGDYVDRSDMGIETMVMLMCYKILYPDCIYLLRGNHECASINRIYGFFDEVKRRFSVKMWRRFVDMFDCMPCSAIVSDRIMCMHGGLSPELETLDLINNIKRPTDIPDFGLLCDLLWADPDCDIASWGVNDRGVSYVFGEDIIKRFCKKHGIDLICRAHQVVEDGYEFMASRQLVTLFSAANYCGEFDNAGGVMVVNEKLCCSFEIILPGSSRDE